MENGINLGNQSHCRARTKGFLTCANKIPQARGGWRSAGGRALVAMEPTVTPASRALLRESGACSGPLDGWSHRRQFGRTRGARHQIAAEPVSKRLPKWHTHIVWMAVTRPRRRFLGVRRDRGGLRHSVDPHLTKNNVRLPIRSTLVVHSTAYLVARTALATEDMAVRRAMARTRSWIIVTQQRLRDPKTRAVWRAGRRRTRGCGALTKVQYASRPYP